MQMSEPSLTGVLPDAVPEQSYPSTIGMDSKNHLNSQIRNVVRAELAHGILKDVKAQVKADLFAELSGKQKRTVEFQNGNVDEFPIIFNDSDDNQAMSHITSSHMSPAKLPELADLTDIRLEARAGFDQPALNAASTRADLDLLAWKAASRVDLYTHAVSAAFAPRGPGRFEKPEACHSAKSPDCGFRCVVEDFDRRLVAVEKFLADMEPWSVHVESDKTGDTSLTIGDAGSVNDELDPEVLSQQKGEKAMHSRPTRFGKQNIVKDGMEQVKQDIKSDLRRELLGLLKEELRKLVLGSNRNAIQDPQISKSIWFTSEGEDKVAEIRQRRLSTASPPSRGSELNVSKLIGDKFFNPRTRAYFALNDVERHTSVVLGKVLKHAYAAWVLIAVLIFSAFMCWGVYKVINTAKYVEIHTEETAWVSGSMALPRIAYKILTPGFSAKIQWCSIPFGNYSARQCKDLVTHQCSVQGRHGYDCFPSGLDVEGTFGAPRYRYVALDVRRNMTGPSATNFANVDVVWDQHITLFHKVSIAQLYAGGGIAHEIYFQKVLSLSGTPIGFAGRQGEDETETLLASEKAMSKAHEYSRLVSGYANSSQILSVFFRAYWSQREDFYESYSILKLLESSGGLWTSVLSIISLSTWTVAITCKHCAWCVRCLHRRALEIRQRAF